MKENFPNLMKEIDMQVQEAQSVPNKVDAKRSIQRHSIIKMPKVKGKERILKEAREKQLITYRGIPINCQLISLKKLQARGDWQEIFKVRNSGVLQPRLLYPVKLSFRIVGQRKSFPDKKKLKEFTITKPLYEMLNRLFLRKRRSKL